MKIQPINGNSCGDEPEVGEEPTRSTSLTSAAANEITSADVINVKPLEASANLLLEDALIDQDKIVIHQDPNDGNTFGILCCCSCDLLSAGDVKHYEISDKFGRRLMEAEEKVPSVNKCRRPYELKISDLYENQIITVNRQSKQSYQVETPPGVCVGYIKRKWSPSLNFTIKDASNSMRIQIKGPTWLDWFLRSAVHCMFPYCLFNCLCKSVSTFSLKDISKNKRVGAVIRVFSDTRSTALTGGPGVKFGIDFRRDMDANMKACVLAAIFVINRYSCCKNNFLCCYQEEHD